MSVGPQSSLLTACRQRLWCVWLWLQWCINGEGSLFPSTTIHTSRGREVQQMQSLTRWKLLFPSENQKDKNNAPFMILERKRTCYILFSYSYRLLLTSTENPGTLMFKKNNTIIIFYWNQLQAMQLVTEKDLMKSDFAPSQNILIWVKWDHLIQQWFVGSSPCRLHASLVNLSWITIYTANSFFHWMLRSRNVQVHPT